MNGQDTLGADLPEFIHAHRPHGPLTADANEPAWNGYLLTVACRCRYHRPRTPQQPG